MEHDRNANHTKANWHFTTPNARIKLKHLIPFNLTGIGLTRARIKNAVPSKEQQLCCDADTWRPGARDVLSQEQSELILRRPHFRV